MKLCVDVLGEHFHSSSLVNVCTYICNIACSVDIRSIFLFTMSTTALFSHSQRYSAFVDRQVDSLSGRRTSMMYVWRLLSPPDSLRAFQSIRFPMSPLLPLPEDLYPSLSTWGRYHLVSRVPLVALGVAC